MTRRRLWLLVALAAVLATMVGALLGALPGLVRRAVVTAISVATSRDVTVDAFEFDVFTGRLAVRGFRLFDRDGRTPLAEFERLDARIHRRSLLRARLWIEEAALRNPAVHLIRLTPDTFNISDLLQRGRRHGHTFDVTVDRFSLLGGRVTIEDRVLAPRRTWTAENLAVEARNVAARRGGGSARVSGAVAGADMSMTIEDLSLEPAHFRAAVTLRDIDLALSRFYIPAEVDVRLEHGRVDGSLSVVHDARDGTRVDGDVRIRHLALGRRGQAEAFVEAPALTATIRGLVLAGRSLELGRLDLAGRGTLLDTRVTPAVRFDLTRVRARAEGITWPVSAPARVELDAAIPGGGDLGVRGTVRMRPNVARLDVRVAGANLAPWARYVPRSAEVSGVADASIAVVATLESTLTTRARGQARVRSLHLAEGGRTLVRADDVEALGIDVQWPLRVSVERLGIRGLRTTIERDERGELPLRALLTAPLWPEYMGGLDGPPKPPSARSAPAEPWRASNSLTPAEAAAAVSPAAARALPEVFLGELLIEDALVAWRDASPRTPVHMDLEDVRMAIHDAAWPARGPARLRGSARVAGGGALAVSGTAHLDTMSGDLRLVLRDAELALYQAYLPIAARLGGKADAELDVRVARDGGLQASVQGTVGVSQLVVWDGARPLLTAERAEVAGIAAQWPGRVVIGRLALRRPSAVVERDRRGEFPLRSLLTPRGWPGGGAAAGSAPRAPDVALGELLIEDGAVAWRDGRTSPPASVDLASVQVAIRDATWPARGPARVEAGARVVGGGELSLRGTARLDDLSADLRVTAAGVDLALARPYLDTPLRFGGTADAQLDIEVTGVRRDVRATVRGTMGVSQLVVQEGTRRLLTAERAEMAGISARWPRRVTVARLELRRPSAVMERDRHGTLILPLVLPQLRPRVEIGELLVVDGEVAWLDASVNPPVRVDVAGVEVSVRYAGWPARRPAQVTIGARVPGGGEVGVRGTVRLDVMTADLRVTVRDADLALLRPYLPMAATISGRAHVDLAVVAARERVLRLAVQGTAGVNGFVLATPERTLFAVERAEAAGITAQWPSRLALERLTLSRPWLLIERDEDGGIPLASLSLPPLVAPGATTRIGAARAAARGAAIEIAQILVEEGSGRFVDRSLTPAYVEDLSRLSLVVSGLTTSPGKRGRLVATATLGPTETLDLRGEIGPLGGPLFVDLTASVHDVAIRRVNPYLARLFAWIVRDGVVSTTLRYRIENGRLEAKNEIILGGLHAVRSAGTDQAKYRIGLPLGLIVALMKDAQGEIRVTVPVAGRLTDGRFDFREAVWGAVRNLTIQGIALPLRFIGQMRFSHDSKIEDVVIHPLRFAPGSPVLTPEGEAQLDRVATFLRGAPAVHLRLKPVPTFPDVEALETGRVAAAARAGEDARADGLRALATRRLEAVQERLAARGVERARLTPSAALAAVAAAGGGRVDFEVTDEHRVVGRGP
jgi:hypothetical protein